MNVIMKPEKLLIIFLTVNTLCISYVTCGITSYIGSFFGFGRTTTPAPLPIIVTSTPSVIDEEIETNPGEVYFDNLIDGSNPSEQYVPIVYYIPAKDLHQSYSENNPITNSKDDTSTNLNSNTLSYLPWYYLPQTSDSSLSNLNQDDEKTDNFPKEFKELAQKLGYKNINDLPPMSVITEALGFSTDQEAIDFILELASTEFGLNLIKSYMMNDDESNNLLENDSNQIPLDLVSDNNELNDIQNILNLNVNYNEDLPRSDFKLDQRSDISPLNHDSSPVKIVTRRQNDEDEETIQTPNRLQSTIDRATANLEIVSKIVRHPFREGLFGTLRHWTRFFTRQPNLLNSDVPTIYGPNNEVIQIENLDSFAEGSEVKAQILNPNGPKPHYIQYPDGSIYMINPLLFNFYNKQGTSNETQNSEEYLTEARLDTGTTDPLIINENLDSSTQIPTVKEIDVTHKNISLKDNNLKTEFNINKDKITKINGTHKKVSLKDKNLKKEFAINKDKLSIKNESRNFQNNFETDSNVLKINSEQQIKIDNIPAETTIIPDKVRLEYPLTTTTLKPIVISRDNSDLDITKTFITTTEEYEDVSDIDSEEYILDSESDSDSDSDSLEQEGQESNIQHVFVKPTTNESNIQHIPIKSSNDKSNIQNIPIQLSKEENFDKSKIFNENRTISEELTKATSDKLTIKPVDENNSTINQVLDTIFKTSTIKSVEENNSTISQTKNADAIVKTRSDISDTTIKNEIQTTTTTTKTTILKLVSSETEWKPQRASGTNSIATGKIYRSDPIAITVPKMIVPKVPKI